MTTTDQKAAPVLPQHVAEAWLDEQRDPGAGRARLGHLAMALPRWRWVVGMSKVPLGRTQERTVYLGTTPTGHLLSARHAEGTRSVVRSVSLGVPVDVLDTATGYLMLSLLHPHDHDYVRPWLMDGVTRWSVHAIPMRPQMLGKMPLGVAVLAVAAERGGWGVRWPIG